MDESPNIAALAAHLADPARARMLITLMDGRALTVSELAQAAGLGNAGASAQVTRLQEAGLLAARREGRHKYMALAGPHVARLVESLMTMAAETRTSQRPETGPRNPALRQARLCYNHLAGSMGVQMYRSLTTRGFLAASPDGLSLTADGHVWALEFGLNESDLTPVRPPLCRDCLDWSERQSHLGGLLGRLLLAQMEASCWLRRTPGSRALTVTSEGQRRFDHAFPLAQPALPA